MTDSKMTRDDFAALDATDPLAPFCAEFELPEDVIYLDGNSLGPLPRIARERVAICVSAEWGNGLNRSWNDAGWIDLPNRVGGKIGAMIGAEPDSVGAADLNLGKALQVPRRRSGTPAGPYNHRLGKIELSDRSLYGRRSVCSTRRAS